MPHSKKAETPLARRARLAGGKVMTRLPFFRMCWMSRLRWGQSGPRSTLRGHWCRRGGWPGALPSVEILQEGPPSLITRGEARERTPALTL